MLPTERSVPRSPSGELFDEPYPAPGDGACTHSVEGSVPASISARTCAMSSARSASTWRIPTSPASLLLSSRYSSSSRVYYFSNLSDMLITSMAVFTNSF
jgi:hypothetical protein